VAWQRYEGPLVAHAIDDLHCLSVFAITGLDYDVLLLHADSDATNEFGAFLRRKLTEFSEPPYRVYHYSGDDVLPGTGMMKQI